MSSFDSSPDVLAFRLDRLRRAPRNWATWIGAFTLVNGLLVLMQSDMMFLGGAVAPYLIGGWLPHFGAGLTLLLLARAVPGSMWGPYVVLLLYALDGVLCGVLGLWSGVFMHLLIFVFVGLARLAVSGLDRQHREALEKRATAQA
jgi:hypothetical protein